MKVLISLFFSLLSFCQIASASDQLKNLSNEQLKNIQHNSDALVIDIRTEKEWQNTGIIPGSHKLKFFSADGEYDVESWLAELKQLKTSPDQPVVLVCRSGNRSSIVGNLLTEKLGIKNISHLSRGISEWIKSGNKISP